MLRIGLTGGIGSGKTFISGIFEHLGIPVYYSDERAKQLMLNKLKPDIINLLGQESYLSNGQLNKPYIGKRIFSDPSLRESLNRLVHPAVQDDFEQWCSMQKSPYILKESALLFESGLYKTLDQIILVTAPLALRIARIQQRDNLSKNDIEARLKSQINDEEAKKLAHHIIVNDEKILILPQIISIHNKLIHYQ